MIFCADYLSVSRDYLRFVLILLSFVLSMIVLILHSSLFILFLGWDGLGVTSYVLVQYYLNWSSLNGAITTLLTNRLGDVCLFWFFCWSWYTQVNLSIPVLVFIVGCFTKSAQFPFSSWLPIAMRAPTPVSSLVHSSTLVTAGVYLLFSYYFMLTSNVFLWILFSFGLITRFFSGLLALVEKDLKKIVALSTLSQLGFLVITLGLGVPSLTLLHLLAHAFFKSCLFVQVGIFIHLSSSLQDGRSYASSIQLSRSSGAVISVCLFRLCGLLFASGFVRKDLVIQSFGLGATSMLFWLVVCLSIIFTYVYSLRLFFMLNSGSNLTQTSSSGSLFSLIYSAPLLILGIVGGWVLLFNTESYPILLRFWGKAVPFGLLFLGVSVLFLWVPYTLEYNVFKIGGADLTVSELQMFGASVFTFFEKLVEFFRISSYKFSSTSLLYLTFFFSGFGGVWFFGLVLLLILF